MSVNEVTEKLENLSTSGSPAVESEEKGKIFADKLYEEGIKSVKVELVEDTPPETSANPATPTKSQDSAPRYNPFGSAHTFDQLNLKPELLRGIAHKKFDKPSKIQAEAMPIILAGVNLLAQAPSGSGKTAAFTLGLLSIIDSTQNFPQALIISPTRELTRQTESVVAEMGQFLPGLKIFLAIPDKKKATAVIDAQVVIGTPGKVYDLVGKRRLNLQKLRVLVLDEADDLLTGADKQADHTNNVLKALKTIKFQKLLFSATWPEEVKNWAKVNLLRRNEKNALLTLQTEELTVSTISQFYLRSNTEIDKIELVDTLFAFLNIGQALIFVSTRSSAQRLAEALQKKNHSVALIHGGTMDPLLRDKAIDSFRSGNTKILVSTDLLSRGIDVLMVNLVINFDLPTDPQTYLHRIGRTGRFGKKGVAINLAQGPLDLETLQSYAKIYNKEIVEIKEDEIPTKLANSITQTFDQYK